MADYVTMTRQNPPGPKVSRPPRLPPAQRNSDLRSAEWWFGGPTHSAMRAVNGHSCRTVKVSDLTDPHFAEAALMVDEVRKIKRASTTLHTKTSDQRMSAGALLFEAGKFGRKDGEFDTPRGLAALKTGEIAVADTRNHRIQMFNGFGVWKWSIGEHGAEDGQFSSPVSLTPLRNSKLLAIADMNNKRVQVIHSQGGEHCYTIPLLGKPTGVTELRECGVLAVATDRGIIEFYKGTKMVRKLVLQRSGFISLAALSGDQMVITALGSSLVTIYNTSGELISEWTPLNGGQLGCLPTSAAATRDEDTLLLADGLNHSINIFTHTGDFLEQVVGPVQDCGSVQAVAVSAEGHVITAEHDQNFSHSIK